MEETDEGGCSCACSLDFFALFCFFFFASAGCDEEEGTVAGGALPLEAKMSSISEAGMDGTRQAKKNWQGGMRKMRVGALCHEGLMEKGAGLGGEGVGDECLGSEQKTAESHSSSRNNPKNNHSNRGLNTAGHRRSTMM